MTFSSENWQQISIVEDITEVQDVTARQKTRDIDAVIDEDVALINSWLSLGWIFEKTFAINQLKANPPTIRLGGDGFVNNIKVILSGEGLILQNETFFDISIAVTL